MNTKNYRTKFAFIIPTLSNRDGLAQVLEDINSLYPLAHVVIVNNGFAPMTIPQTTESLQIITLDQHRNTGFAKACNDGAQIARDHFGAEHLVFLNDDVRFSHEWIEECIEMMHAKKWFATTPLLKKPDGSLENIGYTVLPQGKVELKFQTQGTKLQDLDGLTAAALVMKTDDFFSLKGFDERFFAYLEDVDLFMTAKEKGKKFGTTSSVSVIHHGQATSSHMSTRKAWLDTKNWYLLIAKHWSRDMITKHAGEILLERLRNISGLVKSLL